MTIMGSFAIVSMVSNLVYWIGLGHNLVKYTAKFFDNIKDAEGAHYDSKVQPKINSSVDRRCFTDIDIWIYVVGATVHNIAGWSVVWTKIW